MKKLALHVLIVFCMSLGFMTISTAAEASCRTVAAHWQGNKWMPRQQVCTGQHLHCKWVHRHWRHGHLVGGHKVCVWR